MNTLPPKPNTPWYQEGKLARKLNKPVEDCPYREFSYGYSEWMRGYKECWFNYDNS